MTTSYVLPFTVEFSTGELLASGSTVKIVVRGASKGCEASLADTFNIFAELAATGALAGSDIEPWNSGLQISFSPQNIPAHFAKCLVDERALIVLAHLMLARQSYLLLQSVTVAVQGKLASQELEYDTTTLTTYPSHYRKLPFSLIDEEPETGTYTFVAELREPLKSSTREHLEKSLNLWTKVILAGGYGLAPIPPQESYVEPDSKHVTSFQTTVEWTVFKLRADPACLHSLVNIFAAFHHRCQEVVSLTIS